MPDRGVWTLLCHNCDAEFTVHVQPGERILEFVKSSMCPECHVRPEEALGTGGRWHEIKDYRRGG
ncbi:MAG TPA: hypothetical protein VGH50_00485 [Candidatus Binatia bacterium]|jgi:hypothetical protein